MTVVVDVVFKAKDEDHYKELYATLEAILPDTASYDGAKLVSCAADPANLSFHIHEVWESIDHQKAYLQWRADRGEVDKLVAMLGEPPQFIEREHLVF